jgi:hypothetical protein
MYLSYSLTVGFNVQVIPVAEPIQLIAPVDPVHPPPRTYSKTFAETKLTPRVLPNVLGMVVSFFAELNVNKLPTELPLIRVIPASSGIRDTS